MSRNLQPHPDRMTEDEIVATAERLFEEFGIDYDGWTVSINRRLSQVYGRCNYHLKTIEISAKLALINPADRTENTIRHEIAHALAPYDGHGPVWKRMCAVVGIEPRRCFSAKDTNTIATKRQPVRINGICEPCGGIVVATRKQMPKSDGWRHSPNKCKQAGGAPVTWVRIA
jgi:predicted SprT family Zn-dependent metalloprotease